MTALKQGINALFAEDHDRLDSLFLRFRQEKNTSFALAKQAFREFKHGLQRHIVWEEQILFPLFEEKTGLTQAGPTEVMRMEHRKIGKHLEALHEKVRLQNPACDEEADALSEALRAHNDKEEAVLYPALDYLLSEEEIQGVAEAMERLPEEAYMTCCSHH